MVVLGCFNNRDCNASDQYRKDRSLIAWCVVTTIEACVNRMAEFFKQDGFHFGCSGGGEPAATEIDPFIPSGAIGA